MLYKKLYMCLYIYMLAHRVMLGKEKNVIIIQRD